MTSPAQGVARSSFDRVLGALQRVKRSGSSQATAFCPAHEDRKHPSLSITYLPQERRTLVHCFAADCRAEDIMAAVGLAVSDLWDDPLQPCEVCGKDSIRDGSGKYVHDRCAGRKAEPRPRRQTKRVGRLPKEIAAPSPVAGDVVVGEHEVARYEHINLDGELVAASLRLETSVLYPGADQPVVEKRFRQEYADGRGGWLSRKPAGLRVPLWRLPEIHQAARSGEPVWLVEGHKDAIALERIGAVATTNIAGALAFTAEDAQDLRNVQVRVVCDRDLTGFERGVRIAQLLHGMARSVNLFLPATTSAKSDVYDHLEAGYGLPDLVPVSAERLAALVLIEQLSDKLSQALGRPAREAAARWQRAESDRKQAPKRADEDCRLAQRWVAEADAKFEQADDLAAQLARSPYAALSEIDQARASLVGAAEQLAQLHQQCGVELGGRLAEILQPSADDQDPPPNNVLYLPTEDPDEGPAAPEYLIPIVDRDEWRYSEGTDQFIRGVYKWQRGAARGMPGQWLLMAPLPIVHARVNRRDGSGHKERTDYLLSLDESGRPKTFHRDALKTGQWANTLGARLSFDAKIVAAAATAIDDMAMRAPDKEATPGINKQSGLLDLPAEPLDQYFECSALDPEEALDRWRDIVTEASQAPKLALALGASAIAPFVRGLGLAPHTFSITGAAGQGKTVALRVIAGIWGDSTRLGRMFATWNTSTQGLPGELGEVAILPCYRDEFGLGNLTKAQTASFIYQIAEGTSRTRLDRNYDPRRSRSWEGIFFSTGNGKLTDGIDSGSSQGVPRRVIELATPIAVDSAQGVRLSNADVHRSPGLVQQAYGHLGARIAATVTVDEARSHLLRAHELLPCPDGEVELVARHLYGHVAGALMIDRLLGTGDLCTQAAISCAQEYLATWVPPKSEADRIIDLVEDSLASHLSAWPTRGQYTALQQPKELGSSVPQHGFDREFMGLRDDDHSWVAVFPWAWKRFCEEAGINSSLACQQLEERGILRRPAKARSGGEYQTQIVVTEDGIRRKKRMYQLYLPDPDLDEAGNDPIGLADPGQSSAQGALVAPTGEVSAPIEQVSRVAVPGCPGSVPGDVPGPKPVMTRGVPGVPGKSEENLYTRVSDFPFSGSDSEEGTVADPVKIVDQAGTQAWAQHTEQPAACFLCGVRCVMSIEDQVVHPACWQGTTPQQRARILAQREAPAQEDWTALPKPWPPCVVCDEPASQARHRIPLHAGECVTQFDNQPKPVVKPSPDPDEAGVAKSQPAARRSIRQRFTADSVVLDPATGWLSNGETAPRPQLGHAGDLAEWAHQLRLGFGGTATHLPEPGRVWLTPDLCAELGLPSSGIELAQDAADALTAMREGPFFQAAQAAGWTITGGVDKPWIKLHQGPKSAIITGISWGAGRYDPLLVDEPTPAELAHRLGLLCQAIGYPYTVTPAMTGLNAIEYSQREGLPKAPIPDLPGLEPPYNDIAANPSWIDLTTIENCDPDLVVHVFDRRKSYLAGAGNALVGDGAFVHHPNGCDWDPKIAGFYRLEPLTVQPLAFLTDFDLLNPAGKATSSGWVSSAMLAFLDQNQVPYQIAEAITWPIGGRRLKTWQSTIRQGGETLERLRAQGDPTATALLAGRAFKGVYTDGFGALAQTNSIDTTEPGRRYRPHWRAEIIGTHTANTLRAVQRIHTASQVAPVAIGLTDAVAYLGADTDPASAWPGTGSDSLTNPALGKFKPAGYLRVGQWLEAMERNANVRRPVSQIRLVLDQGHQW